MPSPWRGGRIRGVALGACVAAGLLAPATSALAGPSPQRTVRVRLAETGNPNGPSSEPSLSADGRRVAFTSAATNLVPTNDNGPVRDVFVYDQGTGAVRLVSTGPEGQGANARTAFGSVRRPASALTRPRGHINSESTN